MSHTIQHDEQCVVGIYETHEEAEVAIQAMHDIGIPPAAINLITSRLDTKMLPDVIQHGDETETSAMQGAGAGGLVGLLLGSAILTVPGIGPLLVAGTMACGATGALVGGFLGAMNGWGIHVDHAKHYEDAVKNGKVLVLVEGDPLVVAQARRLIGVSNPIEVEVHARMGDDSPEIDDTAETVRKPR